MMKLKYFFVLMLGSSFLIFFTISSCAHPSLPANPVTEPSQEQPTSSQVEFKTGALAVNPENVHAGEKIKVSANVQNIGSQDGIYTAILLVDGQPSDKKEIDIPANQVNSVEFIVAGLAAGKHTINLGASQISITISPSEKITFADYRSDKYGWEIFTMNSDGTHVTDVTKSASRDVWPTWSPDGTKIAFGSTREWHGMRSIYVMDADGQNVKCLTSEVTDCEFPSWSPDGQKIAYCSSKLASHGTEFMALDIFVMDPDGSNKIAVTQHGAITTNTCPSWFPDSNRIAYVSNRGGLWKIYSVNIDGSDAKQYDVCINNQCGMKYPAGQFPRISVSPDGASIAFDYISGLGRQDVYVLSIHNGEIINLTHEMTGNNYTPCWSTDGKRIAFSSEITNGTGIFIVDIEGNNMPKFTNQYGYFPVWQR